MATSKNTSTDRAPKGATLESAEDAANTLADTLTWAMEKDADPARVWEEIKAVLEPHCQRRSTLGSLRSIIQQTGERLGNSPAVLTNEGSSTRINVDPATYDYVTERLERQDEIDRRLHQAIGIVDLLGNARDSSMDDNSRNNASWAVKDLLKGIMDLTDQRPALPEVVGGEGSAA